jgi:2-amino-4-hydroxy-6-hydroxymethyldihydropteridine diphosphokinase
MAESEKNVAYLGLGTNLGNKFYNIKDAIFRLAEQMNIKELSSIEETDPVGFTDQPKFLNCVIKVETKLQLRELLGLTKTIEAEMGRRQTFKNGPRIIDIDILFFNDLVVDEPDLKIPHPQITERKFILRTLAEISPQLVHPVQKKTISEILNSL